MSTAALGHVISLAKLAGHLAYNGWLDATKQQDEAAVTAALVDYQSWAGLTPDGWAGPITRKTLLPINEGGLRFCGTPDRLFATANAGAGLPQWPREYARTEGISYAVTAGPPKFTLATYKEIVAIALSHIPEKCGAKLRYQSNHKTANVVMGTHRERPGNVLAWSEVPGSGTPMYASLEQSYDVAENWVDGFGPRQGEIGAIHVIRHEWAHVFGVPHGKDLLAPYYDPNVYEFGVWTTAQMTDRYGSPQVEPPPPPPPPTPDDPEQPGPGDFDPLNPNDLQVLVRGKRYNVVRA